MEPEPQKSIVLPIALSVFVSALVFGGLGYYLGMSKDSATTSVTPTATTASLATAIPATADETANWKAWNNKYGISLKYPTDWYLTERQITTSNPIQFGLFENFTPTRNFSQDIYKKEELI